MHYLYNLFHQCLVTGFYVVSVIIFVHKHLGTPMTISWAKSLYEEILNKRGGTFLALDIYCQVTTYMVCCQTGY